MVHLHASYGKKRQTTPGLTLLASVFLGWSGQCASGFVDQSVVGSLCWPVCGWVNWSLCQIV
jgi:hypothetical protein